MLLSAHPDDDVIGAASVLLSGGAVGVAQLTDGVPRDSRWWSRSAALDEEGYRTQRRRESEAALAVAGLPLAALHLLGGRDQDAIEEAVPLARRLAALLSEIRPARLCTHPYEGGHPDHDAAALIGRAAVSLTPSPPELWEMTSYHLGPDGGLASARFLGPAGPEEVRHLSAPERAGKRRMLEAHASQAAVLAQFMVDLERFRPAPRYDFHRPPHAGALLYEREGWGRGETWRARAREALARLGLREDGCR